LNYKYIAEIITADGSRKKDYFNIFENAAEWVMRWLNTVKNNGLPEDYISYSINLQ